MTDAVSTEVEHVGGDLVRPGDALASLYDFLRSVPADDDDDVQERILRSILNATTLDEISKAGASIPAASVLNIPIIVEDIRPDESSFIDGMEVYIHIVGHLTNDDPITVSCGSQDVVVKLARAKMLDLLPCRLTMWQSDRPTKRGFRPIFAKVEEVDAF